MRIGLDDFFWFSDVLTENSRSFTNTLGEKAVQTISDAALMRVQVTSQDYVWAGLTDFIFPRFLSALDLFGGLTRS